MVPGMTEREIRAAHEWQSLTLAKAALDARIRAAEPDSRPARRRLRLAEGCRQAASAALSLARRARPRWTGGARPLPDRASTHPIG